MSVGERLCVDSHWRIVWANTWPVINLTVVSACKIQSFKNAELYVGKIARFFLNTQQRNNRRWIKPLNAIKKDGDCSWKRIPWLLLWWYRVQDPSSHSVCPQRAYNRASDAGNRCHLCEPAGYLSHIYLEENERGFIQPFPHVIHWDNPIRATTSWKSIWAVYSKDRGMTSTPK